MGMNRRRACASAKSDVNREARKNCASAKNLHYASGSTAAFSSCEDTHYISGGAAVALLRPLVEIRRRAASAGGDVRTFKKGKGNALVLGIGVWAQRDSDGGTIHIHITGTQTFHTTVTNADKSERYHRTRFRNLRNLLLENDCWPYGDDGAETDTP